MDIVSDILIYIVALAHLGFLYIEMFLWNKPYGKKAFQLDDEFAEKSAPLAMNQGLYNGFLAAGLFWAQLGGIQDAFAVKAFFLICIIIAGIFGALTASRRIFFIQALPAALALGFLYAS